jgi:ribonuclease HI
MMKQVTIYSDGGCDGNPGPGGWAAILIHGRHRKEIHGACPATTNNRMELAAAIEALRALKEPCVIDFHTDSRYLQEGMTSWVPKWKSRGWRRRKDPLKNVDLWQELDAQSSRHTVRWHWVKAHNCQPENERCDQLAAQTIHRLRAELGPAGLARALHVFLEQNLEQEQDQRLF